MGLKRLVKTKQNSPNNSQVLFGNAMVGFSWDLSSRPGRVYFYIFDMRREKGWFNDL